MSIMQQKLQPETWKSIPGYESFYQISSHGRVKRLFRYIEKRHPNGSVYFSYVRKRFLIPYHNAGYYSVCLSLKNRVKKYTIHRLVASAFIDNPNNLPQVNHIDLNKKNNYYLNLEWTTAKENIRHAVRNGAIRSRKGKPTNFNLDAIPVINTDTGKIYKSIKDAQIDSGLSPWIFRETMHNNKINNTPFKIL